MLTVVRSSFLLSFFFWRIQKDAMLKLGVAVLTCLGLSAALPLEAARGRRTAHPMRPCFVQDGRPGSAGGGRVGVGGSALESACCTFEHAGTARNGLWALGSPSYIKLRGGRGEADEEAWVPTIDADECLHAEVCCEAEPYPNPKPFSGLLAQLAVLWLTGGVSGTATI